MNESARLDGSDGDNGFDLVTIGNICVDLFVPPYDTPPPGGITMVPDFEAVPGGNGLNTAVTAARLGADTAVAGVLGDDLFGHYLEQVLKESGVHTGHLELQPSAKSPVTLVLNDRHGERSFVHQQGTNANYRVTDGAAEAPCRVFHLAAPELLGPFWPDGALQLVERLKGAGRLVTLDIFAVADGVDPAELVANHREILANVDMVFPNEEEAKLITGRKELGAMANYCHELGVDVVVIKRGAAGAWVSTAEGQEPVPTEAVRAVDTCGAGDNFVGGFLASFLRGKEPVEAAALGCALGTLCVTKRGSLTGTADNEALAGILSRFGLAT